MSEPTTTMPTPPTEPRKRRWLLPTAVGVGAFLLGLIIGVAAGGDADQTAADADPAPTVTVTATAAPAAPTEPPAEEAPPTEPPAGDDDVLSDEGWTLANLEVRDDGVGDFGAVGRVTNETGSAVEGALFSLSVLDPDGGVVATMDASVSNVDAGETVTAEFVGVDDYQDGDWVYEFTVTGTF